MAKIALNTNTLTVPAARSQFDEIVKRASGGKQERFVVRPRGKAGVVIMGEREYLARIASAGEVVSAMQEVSVKAGTHKMTLSEINRGIVAAR